MTISIVFDNRSVSPEFTPMWGFSCFVHEIGLLFDTGSSFQVLLANMKAAGIDPEEAKVLFLSHFHWDHTGAVLDFTPKSGIKEAFVNPGFSKRFVESLKSLGVKVTVAQDPIKVASQAISTGTFLSLVEEHGLILETPKGAVLITGCAHPGIVNMVERSAEIIGGKLYGVLGGFHLLNETEQKVAEIARKLDELVEGFVAPCHCTGETAIEVMKKMLPEKFLEAACGKKLLL